MHFSRAPDYRFDVSFIIDYWIDSLTKSKCMGENRNTFVFRAIRIQSGVVFFKFIKKNAVAHIHLNGKAIIWIIRWAIITCLDDKHNQCPFCWIYLYALISPVAPLLFKIIFSLRRYILNAVVSGRQKYFIHSFAFVSMLWAHVRTHSSEQHTCILRYGQLTCTGTRKALLCIWLCACSCG